MQYLLSEKHQFPVTIYYRIQFNKQEISFYLVLDIYIKSRAIHVYK